MSIEEAQNLLAEGIESTLEAFRQQLSKLRTGRANAAVLDPIRVDYYGTPSPLNQVATINVPDARMITVKPFERNMIGAIEKAISMSDLGITPMNDGEMVRLPVPALNEERRKDLVKQAKTKAEEAKIALRNHRRDANDMLKELEKEKAISQDDLKRALDQVQAAVDDGIKEVDAIFTRKEKEIVEI